MSRARDAAAATWRSHERRESFRNLPPDLRPRDLAEAYAAQDEFHALAAPVRGPVAGLKIATTTKVMQALMGIDHPCGGAILASTIHVSPARLACSDFVNLRIECEIAVRLGRPLRAADAPHSAAGAGAAVAEAMPAFELIEDRNAVYKETDALSMIVDNCWNGGIVLGAAVPMRAGLDLGALSGRLAINGAPVAEGKADGPLEALAWLANLAASRGRDVAAGMIVITGSLVATQSVRPGDAAAFEIEGLGGVRLTLA